MAQSSEEAQVRRIIRENSMLSPRHRGAVEAIRIIERELGAVLQPEEIVLTYADRELPRPDEKKADAYKRAHMIRQTDAYAYKRRPATRQTDAYAYERGPSTKQTDALAYDTDAAREQPDVMGYTPGGPRDQVDAVAYERPPESPETRALMFEADRPPAVDVDLLVLTDRRLMRGLLKDGKLQWREVPCDEGGVCVHQTPETAVEQLTGEYIESVWLDISLPDVLCEEDEEAIWCWEVPEDVEAEAAAAKWSGREPIDPGR